MKIIADVLQNDEKPGSKKVLAQIWMGELFVTKILLQIVHLRTKPQALLLVVLENQTNELASIAILNYNLEVFWREY